MARRSPPRRPRARPTLDDALRHLGPADEEETPPETDSDEFEDVAARAKRLGVTIDRVLREYAHIAFADLRNIVELDTDGVLHVKDHLTKANAAAIAEIGTGAAGKGPVRVKLYDKKAALDAIARHLGMFMPPERHDDTMGPGAGPSAEDVREELARRLDRLARRTRED